MKLNNALISGFGKLENFNMDFSNRLSIVYGNNEAGKSTLQTFIWAMLYGLINSDSQKRTKLIEFDKYLPWNDKAGYSGIIKCTLDSGRKLEIHRSFEPHRIQLRDGISGADITQTFSMMKNKEPNFASELLGLSRKEFIGTFFIGQLKIHKFEQNEESNISARLISMAETGDEELSVKKAVERLEEAIRLKIGVEDSRSARPLRLAMMKKEEINEKLKQARSSHELVLELIITLRNIKNRLEQLKNEINLTQNKIVHLEINKLKEKIAAIADLENILKNIESEQESLVKYAVFPDSEWQKVIELNTAASGLVSEIDKIKEKEKSLIAKKESIANKMKSYANFEFFSNVEDDKLSQMESEKDKLDYGLRKDEIQLTSLRQEINKVNKSITEFSALNNELDDTLLDRLREKDLLETNLRLQNKEINRLKEENDRLEFELNKQIKSLKTKKILGIILCCTLIGAIFGIPILLQVKKNKKEILQKETKLKTIRENSQSLNEKFDNDNQIYKKLHNMQISLQQRLGVSNFIELKAKYNEFQKTKNQKTFLENNINEITNKLSESKNKLAELNNLTGIIYKKLQVQDFKNYKDKFKDYDLFNRQKIKINEELEMTLKGLHDKQKDINSTSEKLNKIYLRANVKNYEEFHEHYDKFKKNHELEEKKQKSKERLFLLMDNKELKELQNNLIELESKFSPNNNDSILTNLSDDELKKKSSELLKEMQSKQEEEIQLKTKLEYLGQTLDSVSELEAELEECDEKIIYLKTEKLAIEIACQNIREIAENFHRTRFMPALKELVSPWLKKITGKYDEILVDEKLQIYVRVPESHKVIEISKLSIGVQEQIYFIFKTAIGKMLTMNKEKVPIVLDDIFINFDSIRRKMLWETLLKLSEETQIVLFTCHERFFHEWKDLLHKENIKYDERFIKPEFSMISIN